MEITRNIKFPDLWDFSIERNPVEKLPDFKKRANSLLFSYLHSHPEYTLDDIVEHPKRIYGSFKEKGFSYTTIGYQL